MRNILITGANGFIGRNFISRYVEELKKDNILLMVYSHGDKKDLKKFDKLGLKYKKIDLLDKKSLKVSLPFDLVIHFAANTDTSDRNQSANNKGTKNLIENLKINKRTHIIYTSTTAVYAGRKNCSLPITDATKPAPSNQYGRSKLITERYLKDKCAEKGSKLTILRLCTVYGKNTKKDGLFNIIKNDIRKGGLISRFDWPGLTSLVHVDDVADCVWLVSQNPPRLYKPGEYLVYADSLTLSQISAEICRTKKIKFNEIKLPHFFWEIGSVSRPFIIFFENILPYTFYNMLWRFSLITDHALWCKSKKLNKRIPKWKPRKFDEGVYDVVS